MVIVVLVLYVNHTSACGGLLGMVRVLNKKSYIGVRHRADGSHKRNARANKMVLTTSIRQIDDAESPPRVSRTISKGRSLLCSRQSVVDPGFLRHTYHAYTRQKGYWGHATTR